MGEAVPGRKGWFSERRRRILAYGFLGALVGLILMNLVFEVLVSRYERDAERDPNSPYLAGMTPRDLGPVDAPGAVLFVHGFIGGQSNFNDLPDQVADLGWFVRTIRLPGHGTSPRDFELTTAEDLVDGVREAVRALKRQYPTVIVIGHSMGGALATIAAAEETVDGLVLCAPFFDLSWNRILGISTERLARTFAPAVRWLPGRPNGAPVNLKANRKFVDCYQWIPTKGGLAALDVGRWARSADVCGAISAPVLAIHSLQDTVTSPNATKLAVSTMPSTQKRTIWLEESDHVIFWDYEHEQVASAVLAFIQEVEIP